jgi:hypothetical protein
MLHRCRNVGQGGEATVRVRVSKLGGVLREGRVMCKIPYLFKLVFLQDERCSHMNVRRETVVFGGPYVYVNLNVWKRPPCRPLGCLVLGVAVTILSSLFAERSLNSHVNMRREAGPPHDLYVCKRSAHRPVRNYLLVLIVAITVLSPLFAELPP